MKATRAPNIARFHRAARHYVYEVKRWRGADAQDLVQWMLLEALEKSTQWLAVGWCYQHALDKLMPRHRAVGKRRASLVYAILEDTHYEDAGDDEEMGDGRRYAGRMTAVCLSGLSSHTARLEGLTRFHAITTPDAMPDVLWWRHIARGLTAVDGDARTRRMVQRYILEDWRLHEIGAAEGVTKARVCQILGAVLAKLRGYLTQEDTL